MGDRSLAGLVRVAAARCRGDIAGRAEEIERLAEVGLFDQARRLTRLSKCHLKFLAELSGRTVENLVEMRDTNSDAWEGFWDYYSAIASVIEEEPCWQALSAACELADRVDHFLARHDCAGEGASLARSCRDNTALLGVLADWLMEREQPRAAEEARHLRGLCDNAALDLLPPEKIIYADYFFDVEQE